MIEPQRLDEELGITSALEALCELEQNQRSAVFRQRTHERIEIRLRVRVQPGNSSERRHAQIEGVTGDVSRSGCLVLLPCPLVPGDLYWLSLDDERASTGAQMARCVRCRMVDEETFEAGLRFFSEVDLAGLLGAES
jgi:hypothetical protein